MAQAPFDHVEATQPVRIDGVLAFMPGDAIPADTAKRLGLKGEVVKATEPLGDVGQFSDAPVGVEVSTSEAEDAKPAKAGGRRS